MLAKRIIPCLDVKQGRVVKGKRFQDIHDVADPVELARRYSNEGADELVFYDITASSDDRDIFLDIVEKVAAEITIPFTVGGGIRTVDDVHRVLRAGADKVSINSAAVKNPSLLTEAALRFGNQCIVLSIDAKTMAENECSVFLNGGFLPYMSHLHNHSTGPMVKKRNHITEKAICSSQISITVK